MHLDIHDALTKKIGPLPGGVWAGIVVVGVVAYVHFHKSSASGSSTAATSTDPGTSTLDASGGLLGGGGSGGGVVGSSDGSGVIDTGGSTGTFTDPTPVFVPIPDPGATQFPDSGTTQPVDGTTQPAPAPAPATRTLVVSSSGQQIGTVQAPILPPGTTASEIYASVGLKPSDPYTLTPPAEPQNATQLMEQAQGVTERQAIQTSIATNHPVAV